MYGFLSEGEDTMCGQSCPCHAAVTQVVLLLSQRGVFPTYEVIENMRCAYHFEQEYVVQINRGEEIILDEEGNVSFYSPSAVGSEYPDDILTLLFGGKEIGVIG